VANKLDKRVLEWDGDPNSITTKDKLMVYVDTYARWRIKDPLLFFQRLRDEQIALSRLDDILDGETRNAIAKYTLIDVVRSVEREPVRDETILIAGSSIGNLPEFNVGRDRIVKEIFENSAPRLEPLGIELLDIRFKRINYNESVRQKIYERMISERNQIAERFRSEGQGEAARIIGEKGRELKQIESEAYKTIQEIRGRADAEATDIYAKAYNKSPDAYEFYQFMRTMEIYETTLDTSTIMMLSTDNDFFKYLKGPDTTP
jgi:membrane protease subunit HflC